VATYKNSIYSNLAVIKSKNQYTFYSDGIPIITTPIPDITLIEEMVHFTMLAHPNPKNILILCGGAGGIIKELLKYPVSKITYTELDPLLIKLTKDFPTDLTQEELHERQVVIKYIDGRRFLRLSQERFDVIILNLPMPSTLQLNRLYTKEFFQNIKSVLTEGGIFSLSLPGSSSYINPQMQKLNGSILNTLKDVFYTKVIPGDTNIYLSSASAFEVSPQIYLERMTQHNISTKLINKFHLKYRLNPHWQDWFYDSLSNYKQIRKNSDLLPSATFYSIAYWDTAFSPHLRRFFTILDRINFRQLLLGVLLLGLGLFLLKQFIFSKMGGAIGFSIFTTGFTGMSLNLILIYAYQSFYGFVFSHLALLVTSFMAGLTLGGLSMTKRLERIKNDIISFSKIEFSFIVFSLVIGLFLFYLNRLPAFTFAFIFFLLSTVCGYLVGLEFPLANKIYCLDKAYTKTAGILYGLDLFGACIASICISIFLVPVVGILNTCALLSVLKIFSLIFVIT
jgi:spermidine synthase